MTSAASLILSFISFRRRVLPTLFFHRISTKMQIAVQSNPRGAEMLPPGIIASEFDFYLRRLWGELSEDIPPKNTVSCYLHSRLGGGILRHHLKSCRMTLLLCFSIMMGGQVNGKSLGG